MTRRGDPELIYRAQRAGILARLRGRGARQRARCRALDRTVGAGGRGDRPEARIDGVLTRYSSVVNTNPIVGRGLSSANAV